MRRVLLILLVLVAAGCLSEPTTGPAPGAGPTPTPTPTTPGTDERLSARTLDKGSFSGIHTDTRVLLRGPTAWEALWNEHKPTEAVPAVEWGNESVVAVVVHGPTGCDSMRLGNVTFSASAQEILVEVVNEVAGPDVRCLVAFEDVYHFIAIPTREGDVRFVERDERAAAASGGDVPEPPVGAYAFRTLDEGAASGLSEETRKVITSEAEWLAFWDAHASRTVPPPPAPTVDWTVEHVFAASAGDKANTCWRLSVDSIDVREADVRVQVTTSAPTAEMACGQMITQPYEFVTYPITSKPIFVFEARA